MNTLIESRGGAVVRALVVYSSRTGNTKKVGEAIFDALECDKDFIAVDEVPEDLSRYDIIFAGFWAFRRGADDASRHFLSGLHEANVAVFATAGVYPDSEKAQLYLDNTVDLIPEDSYVLGAFICQGKVASFGEKKKHPDLLAAMDPERVKRLEEAEHHPDEKDLEEVRQFALQMIRLVPESR